VSDEGAMSDESTTARTTTIATAAAAALLAISSEPDDDPDRNSADKKNSNKNASPLIRQEEEKEKGAIGRDGGKGRANHGDTGNSNRRQNCVSPSDEDASSPTTAAPHNDNAGPSAAAMAAATTTKAAPATTTTNMTTTTPTNTKVNGAAAEKETKAEEEAGAAASTAAASAAAATSSTATIRTKDEILALFREDPDLEIMVLARAMFVSDPNHPNYHHSSNNNNNNRKKRNISSSKAGGGGETGTASSASPSCGKLIRTSGLVSCYKRRTKGLAAAALADSHVDAVAASNDDSGVVRVWNDHADVVQLLIDSAPRYYCLARSEPIAALPAHRRRTDLCSGGDERDFIQELSERVRAIVANGGTVSRGGPLDIAVTDASLLKSQIRKFFAALLWDFRHRVAALKGCRGLEKIIRLAQAQRSRACAKMKERVALKLSEEKGGGFTRANGECFDDALSLALPKIPWTTTLRRPQGLSLTCTSPTRALTPSYHDVSPRKRRRLTDIDDWLTTASISCYKLTPAGEKNETGAGVSLADKRGVIEQLIRAATDAAAQTEGELPASGSISFHSAVSFSLLKADFVTAVRLCHLKLLHLYRDALDSFQDLPASADSLKMTRLRISEMWCYYAHVLLDISVRSSPGNATDTVKPILGANGDALSSAAGMFSPSDWSDHAIIALFVATSCPLVGNHSTISISLARAVVNKSLCPSTSVSTENTTRAISLAVSLCLDGIDRSGGRCGIGNNKKKRVAKVKDLLLVARHQDRITDLDFAKPRGPFQSVLSLPYLLSSNDSAEASYVFLDARSTANCCTEANRLSKLEQKVNKFSGVMLSPTNPKVVTEVDSTIAWPSLKPTGASGHIFVRAMDCTIEKAKQHIDAHPELRVSKRKPTVSLPSSRKDQRVARVSRSSKQTVAYFDVAVEHGTSSNNDKSSTTSLPGRLCPSSPVKRKRAGSDSSFSSKGAHRLQMTADSPSRGRGKQRDD